MASPPEGFYESASSPTRHEVREFEPTPLSNESFGTLKLGDIHPTMGRSNDTEQVMKDFPDGNALLQGMNISHFDSPEPVPNTFPGDYQVRPALETQHQAKDQLNALIDKNWSVADQETMKYLNFWVVNRDSSHLTRLLNEVRNPQREQMFFDALNKNLEQAGSVMRVDRNADGRYEVKLNFRRR